MEREEEGGRQNKNDRERQRRNGDREGREAEREEGQIWKGTEREGGKRGKGGQRGTEPEMEARRV